MRKLEDLTIDTTNDPPLYWLDNTFLRILLGSFMLVIPIKLLNSLYPTVYICENEFTVPPFQL